MEPIKPYSLEDFAERHRADFDLHEPRPELWDVLLSRLDADQQPSPASQPRLSVLATDAPSPVPAAAQLAPPALPQLALRTQRRRWQYAGLALALAALVVAAGLGELWKTQHPPLIMARAARLKAADSRRDAADAALYLGADASVMAASQGGSNGNARLDTAVHGMERYYAAQLQDRQDQLRQLAPDTEAEWVPALVSLDSSYQQLKRDLPSHPQPEVVLTAMNRNLQFRLDILDRQLELRGADQLAQNPSTLGGDYTLADSRSVADNVGHHHAR
ncbi:hypothetical protein HHL22_18505 [Hymenobacter sp. RP-2-7]|uniref:Anti-sigma factor n=1 Tax=Hymenobacter polaris TaxID=2682546 RepID=A0A7Y0FP28_9BACT|nr:hypothetical protein [Hymenobacter polaris]NML67201.1 hypothetical protein [Hymenobacter polaris]